SQTHTKEKRRKHHKAPHPLPFKKNRGSNLLSHPTTGQYHQRTKTSRPRAKRDRVQPFHQNHHAKNREQRARRPSYLQRTSPRPISAGQLHPLQGIHTRPITPIIHREP